jgi:hypothetical protein
MPSLTPDEGVVAGGDGAAPAADAGGMLGYVARVEGEAEGSLGTAPSFVDSPMEGYVRTQDVSGADVPEHARGGAGARTAAAPVSRAAGETVERNVTNQLLLALNRVFFEALGFAGNREDYYDPRNSLIHEVLTRKKGNPITLSVVYMAVARRIGIHLDGAECPSHFVVRGKHEDGVPFFVDVFNGGKIMTLEGCKELMMAKNHLVGSADLDPMPPIRVYGRMMRNLINSHMIIGKGDKAMLWTERIRVMETAFSKLQEASGASEKEIALAGSNMGGWRGGRPLH